MKPEWYYTSAGQQLGPFTAAEMKKFAESGKLKLDDLVWKEGMANWVAAKAVKGIFPAVAPKPAEPEPAAAAPAGPANDFEYEAPAPGGKRGKAIKKVDRDDDAPPPDDEDDAPASDDQVADFDDRRETRREPGGLMAYLTFRKMIVPIIIQIVFWFGVLLSMAGAAAQVVLSVVNGDILFILLGLVSAFVTFVGGVLVIRIYCEMLLVAFRILETMTDIKTLLQKRP